MRFNEAMQQPAKPAKEKKPREMPKAGGYKASDLQAKGVKSGTWEKKDV